MALVACFVGGFKLLQFMFFTRCFRAIERHVQSSSRPLISTAPIVFASL